MFVLTTESWQRELRRLWGENLKLNELMSRHTSFRIGGPAEALLVVRSIDDLCSAVVWARSKQVPYHLIGRGSNILVADAGIKGLVIVNRCQSYHLTESAEGVTVFAEAGVGLSELAHDVSELGWSGLEWAAGIPGTLGGAIVGNAGAFGSDISASLTKIYVLDGKGNRLDYSRCCHSERSEESVAETEQSTSLDFSYRSSRFRKEGNQSHREVIILAAELSLHRGDRRQLTERCREIIRIRQKSQPLDKPSAGSVFKNPPQDYAGRLIESTGLKGMQIGGAQVSLSHANFIINVGNGTASDVLALIALIRTKVRKQFSQELDLEIECIGQHFQTVDSGKES